MREEFFFINNVPPAQSNKQLVLVTGGNKGIGKAICKKLLLEHPNVHVVMGSRDLDSGQRAASEIASVRDAPQPFTRLTVFQLDVTSDLSIQAAAKVVASWKRQLYGIVNNAGMGSLASGTSQDIVDTNYFGVRKINQAFGPMLVRPGGRIVNVSSLTAPLYLSGCLFFFEVKGKRAQIHHKLAKPLTIAGGIQELDHIARNDSPGLCSKSSLGSSLAIPLFLPKYHAYSLSKALLNAYTVLHSKLEPDLVINSCDPGFINTDIAPNYFGYTQTPEDGAFMPIKLLTSSTMLAETDGKFYIENKARTLSEIPALKMYPKLFAVIFEKFWMQQEQKKTQRGENNPAWPSPSLLLLLVCAVLFPLAFAASWAGLSSGKSINHW